MSGKKIGPGSQETSASADGASKTTARRQGRPFQKGTSGNPAGRPLGSRNKATLVAENLLNGQSEALMKKLIERALGGDMQALGLCVGRILPVSRERPLRFPLPPLRNLKDVPRAISHIAAGVANGDLTESEARTLVDLVNSFRETHVTTDIVEDFDAVKEMLEGPTYVCKE